MYQGFYQENNKNITELLNRVQNYYTHTAKQQYLKSHLLQEKLTVEHTALWQVNILKEIQITHGLQDKLQLWVQKVHDKLFSEVRSLNYKH